MELFSPDFWSFLWDAERYEAMVREAGPMAPFFAVGAMVAVSFLPLPAETVAVANGMAFGQANGFLYTWIGAMLAACIAFAIARTLGYPIVRRVLPAGALSRFEQAAVRHGTPFLLLVRMIPLVPYTIVNYGSGLTPIPFRTFFWTSALGMCAPIFAFVSAGAMMKDQPWLGWLMIGATIALLGLLGLYIGRGFKRRAGA